MLYTLLDVETTGLSAKDEVIQFAYITVKEDFKTIVKADNFYCMTSVPITQRALDIHKIDRKTLFKLSNGITLEENLEKHRKWFEHPDMTFISYNFAFDSRMIQGSLDNNDAKPLTFPKIEVSLNSKTGRHSFCLQKGFANYINYGKEVHLYQALQTDAVKKYLTTLLKQPTDRFVDSVELERMMNFVFNAFSKSKSLGLNVTNSNFHDAMYDTFCTYILLLVYGRRFTCV